jgi:hypothetical protein
MNTTAIITTAARIAVAVVLALVLSTALLPASHAFAAAGDTLTVRSCQAEDSWRRDSVQVCTMSSNRVLAINKLTSGLIPANTRLTIVSEPSGMLLWFTPGQVKVGDKTYNFD